MKKILIITLTLILINVEVFAHKQDMHQHITREAFELLRMSFPVNFTGLDEMESYIGTDETSIPGAVSVVVGHGLVVSGVWIEDEYDIVEHYGIYEIPNYNNTPPWVEDLLFGDHDANRAAHTTITHFWDADNGEETSTYLTDTIYWGELQHTWEFTISENSIKKNRKYISGDYLEREIFPDGCYLANTYPPVMVMITDWQVPGIVNLYHGIGARILDSYLDVWGEWHDDLYYTVSIQETRKEWAYNRLGRMCHLLQDMSVPAHVHCTSHAGVNGMYSDYFENHEMGYHNNYHTWTSEEVFTEFGGFIDPYVHDDSIYFLTYFLNQMTDHYADGKVNGDDIYDTIPGLQSVISTLGVPTLTSEINDTNCKQMYDVLIPYAIRATAGLMYWFAVETDQIDPLPEPVIVSGNVSLIGGNGDIENVSIIFNPQNSGSNIELNPGYDGSFSYVFSYNRFDTYDITYLLNDYYPVSLENIQINENFPNIQLPDITLYPIISNNLVFVSADPQNHQAFHNIQDAVDYLQNNEGGTVVIEPGTYTGEKNRNISWNGNQNHIRLFGINNSTIVCTEEGSYVFKIINGNENDVIRGFDITNNNYAMGSNSAIIINGGSPIIRDNYIYDWISCAYAYTHGGAINITYTNDAFIYNNTFENVKAFFGGAISCSHSTLEISNNNFINNTSWYESQTSYAGTGGALYGVNCTINLHDNTFSSNESYNGSAAVDLSDCTSTSIIQKNTFTENVFVSYEGFGEPCSALRLDCSDIDVSYNKFINNHKLCGVFAPALYMDSNNIVFNNTFIGNDECMCNEENSNIYNCIFANNDFFGGGGSFEYCLEYNTTYQYSLPEFGESCIFEPPELDPVTFQPIWNTTIMSSCIDTGDPASPLDPDDTPADIGAVRAVTHDFHLTTAEHDRYRYRSIPVIDRDYMQQGFETTYFFAPVEEQTQYFIIFDQWHNEKIWEYENGWSGYQLETLDSVIGYKLQTTSDVEIPTSGRTLAENTQVDLVAGENWVGYFVKKSMGIQDAFQDIWDHIESIYSEDWAWESPGIPSSDNGLIYGKMYIVRVDEACSFVYGDGTPVPPKERGMTEGFYYVEAPTYSPINIESLGDSTVVEVGVFMDGECIGATQVEDFPLQILAFAPEGSRGSGDITFDFYYGGRSYKPAQDYKVLNKETGQYFNSKLKLRPYEFTTICFGNPPTPIKFTLSGNYPNPFNPITTISYSIPTDGNVELIIYNIMGQKVKTLISGTQPTGVYNVTW
ncbi:MAG: hypothetical protein HQ534_13860, partial [Armatimonadetes bacterium]|nr:hypothetical protein [Armatimonadota bacterium]